MNNLKFPIGIADFQAIRNRGYYYVDKTPHIERMIEQGQYFFLSRPRRFGKSLLLDTMLELFEGNEPLFRGLHIHDRWDWSIKYPVVRLSFGAGYNEPGDLESDVMTQLEFLESANGLESAFTSEGRTAMSRLWRLLHHLHVNTGQQVVVLVDEYDKPILDAIDKPELAVHNRDYLRGFYGVIKDCVKQVRFVFITGITMFSKVSLFSALNNLNNISLDPRHAAICGYTETDLDTVFAQELGGLDRNEIRRWYNGYSWGGEDKVYNPYDILHLLDTREFDAHWFTTGLPTFLYKVMMDRQFTPLSVENLKVKKNFVSKFDVYDISAEALMFQTGYLTITGEQGSGTKTVYTLDYPNIEIRESLNDGFLGFVSDRPVETTTQAERMGGLLVANDFEGFSDALRTILSSIPYHWHGSDGYWRKEAWYASVLYACLVSTGYDVRAEESTSRGRSDLVLLSGAQVFVFELKMLSEGRDPERMAADAILQIRERGYADKHREGADAVHLIGVVFSAQTRNLVSMKVESD